MSGEDAKMWQMMSIWIQKIRPKLWLLRKTTAQESCLDNDFWLKIKFSGKFESYDYGSGNMAHYGQESPINYDLTKVLKDNYIFGNVCTFFDYI